MNNLTVLSIVAAALTAFLTVAPAQAVTVSECQQLITVIQQDVAGVAIGGNNPDQTRSSLSSKLSSAIIKLNQGKFCDAINKLQDFKISVLALAVPNAKGETKLDPADANRLAAEADEAIQCIAGLLPAGTTCP